MSAQEKPRCIEVSISASADGKISIEQYEWSSGWHVNMARKFEIPEGWTDEQVEGFQLEQYGALYDVVDMLDTEECTKRRKASNVDSVRLGDDE